MQGARITHFSHFGHTNDRSTSVESIRRPFESRIWYAYPGQTNATNSGSYNQPIAVGRVLDDGTTQLTQYAYDTASFFKLTKVIDPVGRTTSFVYPNGIDLAAITQTGADGLPIVVAQWSWNYQHRPLMHVDAAGQPTTYTWNARGQPLTVTNALGQTTSYAYDGNGRLSTITNANNAVVATFTWDAFDRVASFTDSEGWSVAYAYDAADRLTRVTYLDGTTETWTWDKLDLVAFRDRMKRTWSYTYDANRRRTKVRDPAGNETLYGYDPSGRMTSLTDPKGNVTRWTYDAQGRRTSKIYADGTTWTYTYEATTSRLRSVTDALGQIKRYSYTQDDRLAGIAYLNAVNATPNVTFAYDPVFPRLVSMTDGTGTSTYSYVPVGQLGALRRAQETSALPDSAIAYTYDALGRMAGRTVQGSGPETFQYDAIGRVIGRTNDLGSFTLGYLGETQQITSRALASSTLATTWSYLDNAGDRRLQGIGNVGLSSGEYSNFQFTTRVDGSIASVTETSDVTPVYPAAGRQLATYSNLNQLVRTPNQALTYDANGNLLSDGQRVYSWDAEGRLIGILYPGAGGKQTAFTYDGRGRRATISSTPTGGSSTVTVSYRWCGGNICQARDAGNSVTRTFYSEGEYVPGTPAQAYHYATDQIGSVRRAFAPVGSPPTYAFDPYGVPLQATAPVTDFGYATLFVSRDSGLNLSLRRAYDSRWGRWISRDPKGETTDPTSNLYAYVGGQTTINTDPYGTNPLALAIPGAEFGGVVGSLLGPPGTAIGAAIGAAAFVTAGVIASLYADAIVDWAFAVREPGKPTEAEGFKDPKSGEWYGQKPRKGRRRTPPGYLDDKGRLWCPTGPEDHPLSHGGSHWDVQYPDGNYKNVFPGQHVDDVPFSK